MTEVSIPRRVTNSVFETEPSAMYELFNLLDALKLFYLDELRLFKLVE